MRISEFQQWAKSKNINLTDEMGGFQTGEFVNVINGYGIVIENLQIKGFDLNPSKERPNAVAYVYDDCYWFAIELNRLIKLNN